MAGMEVIYDLLPIDLLVKELAVQSLIRTERRIFSPWNGLGQGGRIGHRLYWSKKLTEMGITDLVLDDIVPVTIMDRNYSIDLKSLETGRSQIRAEMEGYTDGSKLNDRVGSGWIVLKNDKMILQGSTRLKDTNTVFQAEITAITKICERLGYLLPEDITINCDSQAAILALDSCSIKHRH